MDTAHTSPRAAQALASVAEHSGTAATHLPALHSRAAPHWALLLQATQRLWLLSQI